jgi:hypothetical protein
MPLSAAARAAVRASPILVLNAFVCTHHALGCFKLSVLRQLKLFEVHALDPAL